MSRPVDETTSIPSIFLLHKEGFEGFLGGLKNYLMAAVIGMDTIINDKFVGILNANKSKISMTIALYRAATSRIRSFSPLVKKKRHNVTAFKSQVS